MIQQFVSRQFLIFLVTGGIAATANFSSRILYNLWMNFSSAVILAYITGMITAFILAKIFVFKESKQSTHRSILLFILVNMFALVQTWVVSMVLAYYVFPAMSVTLFANEISHAVGVIIPVFTSYVGHKRWSFR
ncbi:MAG: GtrA family protein [Alphaproteobacteria bacterium]|nr:GtrA family protein [Alphaproteobacteria bacterium]